MQPWTRMGRRRCLLVLETLGTLKMSTEFEATMDVKKKFQVIYYEYIDYQNKE